jgi:hypothetical protein
LVLGAVLEKSISMQSLNTAALLVDRVSDVLAKFSKWLDVYGETSRDHQSFFAGPVGGRAKSLYYRHRIVGTAAVAPMILFEAFLPSARRLFHHPIRFPIADAHYAMAFTFLFEATGNSANLDKAVHFLSELKKSRCRQFNEYCWGYPFDWVTRAGIIKHQTPLITTTPYVYEAFLQVSGGFDLFDGLKTGSGMRPVENSPSPPPTGERAGVRGGATFSNRDTGGRVRGEPLPMNLRLENASDRPLTLSLSPSEGERVSARTGFEVDPREEWKQILESIVRHVCVDIKDFQTSPTASSCSYTPFDKGGVINAAAYRAFLLTSASQGLSNADYWRIAERNLNFVLEAQNADGSWFYAVDGVRDFVDHFHTCFVMKALAKIHSLTGHEACLEALSKAVHYYLENLFGEDGLPRPFSRAPRLTVYKRELYDCAECINLCLLLRDRFPQLETKLESVIKGVLKDWIKPDGSFRSRRLLLGWDNVPMHRWAQSQMFRSLAFYFAENNRRANPNLRDFRPESAGTRPSSLVPRH